MSTTMKKTGLAVGVAFSLLFSLEVSAEPTPVQVNVSETTVNAALNTRVEATVKRAVKKIHAFGDIVKKLATDFMNKENKDSVSTFATRFEKAMENNFENPECTGGENCTLFDELETRLVEASSDKNSPDHLVMSKIRAMVHDLKEKTCTLIKHLREHSDNKNAKSFHAALEGPTKALTSTEAFEILIKDLKDIHAMLVAHKSPAAEDVDQVIKGLNAHLDFIKEQESKFAGSGIVKAFLALNHRLKCKD